MEALVGFVVVCLVVKWLIVDAAYGIRWGKMPPRMHKRMKELEVAAKAGQAPRPGLGDYLQTVWNDVWEQAIKDREARRADPDRAKTQKGPLRQYVGNWWDEAWKDAEAKRRQRRAARHTEPAEPEPPAAPMRPDAGARPEPAPAQPKPAGRPPASGPAAAPPETQEPAAEPPPARGPSRAPADTDDGQPLAVVIPFPKEDTDMFGEVTGLVTAQQYAAGMAQAMADQVPATEQFVASLTANEVSGDAVAAAAHAQELSLAASQAWQAATDALHRQDVVKEAYGAVPEAGTKEFVTSE
jgi:hypothetical protein